MKNINPVDPVVLEVFEMAARALCPGDSWKSSISKLLNVRTDTVRNWLRGRMSLHSGHLDNLIAIIEKQKTELDQAHIRLKELNEVMKRREALDEMVAESQRLGLYKRNIE